MKEIKKVTVLGAGAMGAQIGALAAEAGYDVKIRDIEDKFLEKGRQLIESNYDRRISRGRLTEEAKKDYMSRMTFGLIINPYIQNCWTIWKKNLLNPAMICGIFTV